MHLLPIQTPAPVTAPLVRLWLRLTRRGAALLASAMAAYVFVEVVAFNSAYPDAASRATMSALADNPAVRMLQGVPRAVGTTGGYVVWDAGWFIELIVGVWAVIVATRLFRGEEETDRLGLILTARVSARHVAGTQLAVLGAACLLTGAAVAGALAAAGTPTSGALLFGAAVAGLGATFVAGTAVLAQVFAGRRQVLAAASAGLGAAFVARMVANSSPDREFLGRLTPFGWIDQARAFEADRWWALAPLVAAPLLLGALALRLRGRRDTGSALVATTNTRTARTRGLGGPTVFAWRMNRGVLLGWLAGLAMYAAVIGSVAPAVRDLTDDPDYRKLLESMGMDFAFTDRGFVAMMGPMVGLVVALYTCWRIGAARTEEAAGLAEAILSRPVGRLRWLSGHVGLSALGAVLLGCAAGTALWLGAGSAGADLTLGDALAAGAGSLPVVPVFLGLAVLLFGLAPRLAVGAAVGVAVLAYLTEFVGPALGLPAWALALSPFHHLAYVPVEPFATVPALTLTGVGLALAAGGFTAFRRRDIASA